MLPEFRKPQRLIGNAFEITAVDTDKQRSPGIGNREHEQYGNSEGNKLALSLACSRIINPNCQEELLTDVVQQWGYLSLLFQRVHFWVNTVKKEIQ